MKADPPGMEDDVLFSRDEGRSEHMYTVIFVYFHMKFNMYAHGFCELKHIF